MLLGLALALLVAQAISAALLYRAQAERRDFALVHAAAFRLYGALDRGGAPTPRGLARHAAMARGHSPDMIEQPAGPRGLVERLAGSPLRAGEQRDAKAERDLRAIFADLDLAVGDVVVVRRTLAADPFLRDRLAHRARRMVLSPAVAPGGAYVAAIRRPDAAAGDPSGWLVAHVPLPGREPRLLLTLLAQALLTYALLVGAMALLLRRITRPLAALAARIEGFGGRADGGRIDGGQPLTADGPDDVQRLIAAHNAMAARISALLDEKDVMLGAIGHDLKTPLAALRVRIESVEDPAERGKMAATIEDITRSLDDILSLARVGRPSDPREPVELSALVASVIEEYEDLGEPVTLSTGERATERIVLPLRVTWLRRALRNLIGNALRYGGSAHVSLVREGASAVIAVADNGPGIAPADLARMVEPFVRGEPSRSSATGGAGLGLTLARAIAEQHGGTLTLANRPAPASGLIAELRLPLE